MFQDGSDSGSNQFLGSFPHPVRGQLEYFPEFASLCMISRTFNSLFKVLFIFPSRYLFTICLSRIFRFRWNIPPILCCSPKQHDSRHWCYYRSQPEAVTGLLPSTAHCLNNELSSSATCRHQALDHNSHGQGRGFSD